MRLDLNYHRRDIDSVDGMALTFIVGAALCYGVMKLVQWVKQP